MDSDEFWLGDSVALLEEAALHVVMGTMPPVGTVIGLDGKRVRVDFDDGQGTREYEPAQLVHVEEEARHTALETGA